MLPITERTIAPGVTLRAVQTKKFKTATLAATFLEPLQAETASLNALLPKVLHRGTKDYPDMEALSAALDDPDHDRLLDIVRYRSQLAAGAILEGSYRHSRCLGSFDRDLCICDPGIPFVRILLYYIVGVFLPLRVNRQ